MKVSNNNKIFLIVNREAHQPVSGSTNITIYVHMQFGGEEEFLRLCVATRMCGKTVSGLGFRASVPFGV